MEVKINEPKKVITIDFPIATGKGYLTFKQIDESNYDYTINLGTNEETVTANKPLWNIGSTRQCNLFKRLNDAFDRMGASPYYSLSDKRENFDKFLQEIQSNSEKMKKGMKKWEIKKGGKKDPKEISFFEMIGEYETFNKEMTREARKLIEDNEFLEYVVETMSTTTKAQAPKLTFCFLIAMSSIMKKPINSLCIASPSAGKSQINEAVFEMFPRQRRFKFDSESTIAGIARMTEYKEGKHVLANKPVYAGDLGNEDELEKQSVKELMSVLKRLMSSQQYNKIIANTQSDNKEAMILNIEGFGALMVETTAKNPEAQFMDRSVTWSPDENNTIWGKIKEYLTDDFMQWSAQKSFNKRRPIVAAGIDLIFGEIEKLYKTNASFDIFNPFKKQMIEPGKIFKATSSKMTPRTISQIVNMPNMVVLTNYFAHDIYINKEDNARVLVLTPKEYIYILKTIEKPLAYMISPISENTLSYVSLIEQEFFEKYSWPYTFAEYRTGFKYGYKEAGDIEAQASFNNFINECHPITKSEIKQLKNVSATTAGGYLAELVNMELLYVQFDGTKNNYYPVSNFIEQKESGGLSLLTEKDFKKGSELWNEAEEIYKDFIEKLKRMGFEKL